MRFSVLLPTRNGGRFLPDVLASALGQSGDFELIVADNANTDETGSELAKFRADSRLRVVRHSSVKSVTENWMSALDAASGEYMVMLGDDDCLLPGYFSTVEGLLERYNEPDSLVYNGFSYVFPGAVGSGSGSYYADPHFHFDRHLSEGELTTGYRRRLVHDMFRFKVKYPLNIQLTLFSRRAVSGIPGSFFRPPFPDHFAINSLLLKARSIVYAAKKLVVIGVSPKSFGHFVYGGDQRQGMSYLGSDSNVEGKVEGSELLNSMHNWLELLRQAYPLELGDVKVDRSAYVRRQVAQWAIQYRLGAISGAQLGRRFARLRPRDRWIVATTFTDPEFWRRLPRLAGLARSDRVRSQWPGMRPLRDAATIGEFIRWLGKQEHQGPLVEAEPSGA